VGAYRCAPAIVWVKDLGQTILLERESGRRWVIHGTEAMVWDLLTMGYAFERIVRFLAVMLEIPVDSAQGTLLAILHGWGELGIVQPERRSGHG
jgi:hypothetical protein